MRLSFENIRIALLIGESWVKNSIAVTFSNSALKISIEDSRNIDQQTLQPEELIRVKKVVKGIQRLSPFFVKRRKCLMEALIVFSTLKRIGVFSKIRIGARAIDKSVKAHAWVTIGQDVIIGGPVKGFEELIRIH